MSADTRPADAGEGEDTGPLHYHLHAAVADAAVPGIDIAPAKVEEVASHVTWWLAERATHLLTRAEWHARMPGYLAGWRDAIDAREPIRVGPFAGVVLHAVPHGECDCAAGA